MLKLFDEDRPYLVVGLMSGTSVDGIDAALCEIANIGENTKVKLIAFENTDFPPKIKKLIFELFDPQKATVDKVASMNVALAELYANASLSVISLAGKSASEVDLIASHGQTIYHHPVMTEVAGIPVHYTVQIGEGSVISARTGITTVSDFRVADMAFGGQGAPVVPFTEYLTYRRKNETILLQNIGGIGNMTIMPASAKPEDVYAFDTGPGNMIMDAVMTAISGGEKTYDSKGEFASRGKVCIELLEELKQDKYYSLPLPKTTGREEFGLQYTEKILTFQKEHAISNEDLMATVTALTAWSIVDAYEKYVLSKHIATEIIIGGGGSYNLTLMSYLKKNFAVHAVKVSTQEDNGLNSDAKEAVAFALLGACCAKGIANALPTVTGASIPAVMGKISFPSVAD